MAEAFSKLATNFKWGAIGFDFNTFNRHFYRLLTQIEHIGSGPLNFGERARRTKFETAKAEM